MNSKTSNAKTEQNLSRIMCRVPKEGTSLAQAPSWSIQKIPVRQQLQDALLTQLGSGGCCVMAGSLITLADGSTQAIESFVGGEKVRTLSGLATVQALEIVQLGVTRRMIELDAGQGESLYITDDHPLWTELPNGQQWWGTYNFNHYLYEKETGQGSFLVRDAVPLRFDLQNKHAHVLGWKQVRPTFCQLPPQTPVYHLAVDRGGSYIANGFVITSHCRDEDAAGVNWQGLQEAALA